MIDDRPDEAKRLEQARLARGFTTAKDAATYFGWNYDTYIQHENGTRGLSRVAERYAEGLRTSAAWLRYGAGDGPQIGVPLKGYVGAGGSIVAEDNGSEGLVEPPAQRTPDTVAAIVRGNSMFPTFRDGWIIYWSRLLPPAEMINQLCVVQLESDEIYIKVLRAGSRPDLWTLQSINVEVADIEDKAVQWVAPIDWIKPK